MWFWNNAVLVKRQKRAGTQMNAEKTDYKHKELSDAVICCFYTVYNALGYGFLEKVYENALLIELGKRNIAALPQCPIPVYYDKISVGEYFADIVVEDKIIVEVKAARAILAEHEAQLLNYLKATEKEVGLILNFAPAPQVRRKAFDNGRK
jgi:GxxExxY protein